MKALAASSISQYEQSVLALADYARTVELGLSLCFRQVGSSADVTIAESPEYGNIDVIVFGSDQGLVGQFNDVVTDFAMESLLTLPANYRVWAVGERVNAAIVAAGLSPVGLLSVPNSVQGITPLVAQILLRSESLSHPMASSELHLFYNTPMADAVYVPVHQRLLPLDERWRRQLAKRPWPTAQLPEVLGAGQGHPDAGQVQSATLGALVREYLFVSLFRACAESLASENASRLAAMQRADKNIDELMADLDGRFFRLRQRAIDAELFDVIAGFEAFGGRPSGF